MRSNAPASLRRIVDGAQRGRSLANADLDRLATSAAQLPNVARGNANGRERGRGGFADLERRAKERIVAVDMRHVGRRQRQVADRHQLGKDCVLAGFHPIRA